MRNDLNYDITCAESLFIEIIKPRGENIIVGVVYRPPAQDVKEFVTNTDSLINKISRENKICYIMGDFNLNLLNCQNHKLTSEFLDTMYSNMFSPLITRPTRITSYNATLIDNIFTNNLDNCSFSGLFFTDISDHLPIFCLPYNQEQVNKLDKNIHVVFRDNNNVNVSKFRDKLGNINWVGICRPDDPINMYSKFLHEFMEMFNTCFPLCKKKVRSINLSKPWMTKGLLISIKRKNKLYKKYLRKPRFENMKI